MIFRNLNKLNKVYSSVIRAYASQSNDFTQIVYELASDARIALVGTGKNYGVAYRCADTFNSLGLDAVAIHANDLVHGSFGALARCNMAIYLSKSGKTSETNQAIAYATNRFPHIKQWLFTCKAVDKLPGCDTIVFDGIVEMHNSVGTNIAPTMSCLLFGFVLDLLASEASNASPEDFKLFHPGGSIGGLI